MFLIIFFGFIYVRVLFHNIEIGNLYYLLWSQFWYSIY